MFPLRVLLSVKQRDFYPNEKLLSMMETFRLMLNDCIRIGLARSKRLRSCLCDIHVIQSSRNTGSLQHTRTMPFQRASGILSNYRKLLKKGKKVNRPYCTKPMITTCKSFTLRVEGNTIVLPSKIRISLNDYVLNQLHGRTEIRSATVSTRTFSLCLAKETEPVECTGILGIDMNYENMTFADTLGNIKRMPMEDVAKTKLEYREVKTHFTRNDARIRKQVFAKYGKLQADKSQSEIHKFSSRIIKHAKKNHVAVALEQEIRDIRNLYRKGNGQGKDYRFRLNSWARGEARRQLEYKGRREGVLVFTVSARGTSAKCSSCGNKKMIPEENRMLYCASCGLRIDRDVNAALNIRNRGLEKLFSTRFSPIGLPKVKR